MQFSNIFHGSWFDKFLSLEPEFEDLVSSLSCEMQIVYLDLSCTKTRAAFQNVKSATRFQIELTSQIRFYAVPPIFMLRDHSIEKQINKQLSSTSGGYLSLFEVLSFTSYTIQLGTATYI